MLDLSKLEKVRHRGDKIQAACPVCRSAGRDKKGNHLSILDHGKGKFHCIVDCSDKEIFSLVGIPEDHEFTPAEKAEYARQRKKEKLRIAQQEKITNSIKAILMRKLEPYLSSGYWHADLWHESPIILDNPENDRHEFIRRLFKPTDVLWLGERRKESGSPVHKNNFKTCEEWLKLDKLPQRIAAGTFKTGVVNRSLENVISSPFTVLESDSLSCDKPKTDEEKERNKALSYALIGYAQDALGLHLRAVVDSGNKSLHAWFDTPSPRELDVLQKMANGLMLDHGVLTQRNRPLRMPGCVHSKTNKKARILYLNHLSRNER